MGEAERYLYFDHAASTPVRPEVARAMSRCMAEVFGNPSSAHSWGRAARRRLEQARSSVAESLEVTRHRVVFTRGGTESDNIAILGRVRRDLMAGIAGHVVTTPIEHPAVLEATKQAVLAGARCTMIGFAEGRLDMESLERALESRPSVVSCIWVDNDTGLLLPMDEISALCRARDTPLHSDAVQALGKVPVSLRATPVDLLTVAGHKVYGPKSTGALVLRDMNSVEPLHAGGDQEMRLRPGTEDVVGAVGFAEAIRLAVAELPGEATRLKDLTTRLESRLLARTRGIRVHGAGLPRAPHIVSLGIADADSDTLVAALDALGVAASKGSACSGRSRASTGPLATPAAAEREATLRLSVGKLNGIEDIDRVVDAVCHAVGRTREWVGQGVEVRS